MEPGEWTVAKGSTDRTLGEVSLRGSGSLLEEHFVAAAGGQAREQELWVVHAVVYLRPQGHRQRFGSRPGQRNPQALTILVKGSIVAVSWKGMRD